MKKVVVVLMSVLLLVGCGKSDTQKFKEEYEALNGNNNLITISIDTDAKIIYSNAKKTVSILENGTGIIYFGFPSCPWCRNALPVLIEAAKENDLPIYYMNPSSLRGSNNKHYLKIMSILDNYLETNEEGKKVLYVPDIYFIKDGKIVGHHLGTIESQKNPTIPLEEEQQQELKTIYEDFIKEIK